MKNLSFALENGLSKKEYELIISNKSVEYKKYLKEKNDRITYLEKQNLKLSLIENKN